MLIKKLLYMHTVISIHEMFNITRHHLCSSVGNLMIFNA